MKIVKSHKDKFCIFCKKELDGELFVELNSPILNNLKKTAPLKMKQMRFIHQIHLSCAYNFLKKLKHPNTRNEKQIKELEDKYSKEMMMEKI